MAEQHNDLLMKFVRSNGQELDAECTAQISGADDLTEDFVRGKFFEVQEFGFGAGLDDDDAPKEPPEKPVEAGKKPPKTAPKPFALKYARFMNAGGAKGSRGYPVDIDTISFSRLMDRGSTLFFQDLCGLKTFETATLVKRRMTGGGGGMQSYLRMDFTDVLMVGLDWEDGEPTIKEKYKFICRGVMVQYKPQASDGSLGAAIPGGWPQGQG